jgi:hypothetical protein
LRNYHGKGERPHGELHEHEEERTWEEVHINMTKAAIHFAVIEPFIGDASLKGAVSDFTEEARKEGAQRVRIVQSDETTLWWILPPVSFLFTPKFTNVAGEALLAYDDTTPQRQMESKAENLKAD